MVVKQCGGDPESFHADPDPTFHADADLDPTFHADSDPDPNFLARERKFFFFKSSTILSKILLNLTCIIFSVTMWDVG